VPKQCTAGCQPPASTGHPPQAPHPRSTSTELVDQYVSGCSGLQLADHYRCSPATIYRRLETAGVDRRQPSPAVDRSALTAALAHGLSAPQIAAQLDVSVTAVCRALRREQLQTPTQAARQRSTQHLTAILAALEHSQ